MFGILKNYNEDYNKVNDLIQVPNNPFFYGSLGIIYGVVGQGKSWQLSTLIGKAGEKVIKIFIDCDGANGGKFVKHCGDNDVEYVKANVNVFDVPDWDKKSILDKVISTIESISAIKEAKDKKIVIALDSLSSIGDGIEINNSEKIAPTLYKLNRLVENKPISLILIDHATIIRDKGRIVSFKIEGNESGKLRATASAVKYEAIDSNNPQDGGTFTVVRTRDTYAFRIGSKFEVINRDELTLAKKFIVKKMDGKDKITQSEFTTMVKNPKDKWIKSYKNKLFDTHTEGKTTILTLRA